MENISIKPNQPMNLSLENVSHLVSDHLLCKMIILFLIDYFLQKNPRLFISLDSDDQPNLLRSSGNITDCYL